MAEHNGLDGKLMTVGQAVERFVHDGDQICVGGFTITRNPMASTYEIARRRIKDLHLVAHSNGQALDVLVGAGCVRRLDIAYGGNGRFAPTCIRFRKAVERGELQVEDYTNNMMSLRFLAGALSVPFIPSKSGLGTDVVEKSGFPPELRGEDGVPCEKVIVIDDPFGARRRRGRAPPRAHARRLHHPRPAGQHRRHRAHQGPHLRRPRAVQGVDRGHRHLRGDRPRALPAARPRPERAAAVPRRRGGAGALRRPPHRLPLLLRLRPGAPEPVQGRRPRTTSSGRPGWRSGCTASRAGTSTWTRSEARSWRASAPTPSPATRPAWTGGERDDRAHAGPRGRDQPPRPPTRPAR